MVMNLSASSDGCWNTPDALGGDVTNPQSLNRYAYVTDNPASLNDPLGLFEHTPEGCSTDATGFGYTCANGSDQGSGDSDFSFGFLNPIPSSFLPSGNDTGNYLMKVTVTSNAIDSTSGGKSLTQRVATLSAFLSVGF